MGKFKAIASFVFGILFLSNTLYSQAEFGLFGGVHSYSIPVTDFQQFKAGVKDADYGVHIGAKLRIKVLGVFVEPAVVLNNVTAKYVVDNPDSPQVESTNLNFDVPAMIGIKVLPFTVFAGPVAHIRFTDYDDVIDRGGYDDNISKVHYGVQVGAGLMIGKIGVDFRYEKNFRDEDVGAQELYNELGFVDTNSRVIGSLVYMLGK